MSMPDIRVVCLNIADPAVDTKLYEHLVEGTVVVVDQRDDDRVKACGVAKHTLVTGEAATPTFRDSLESGLLTCFNEDIDTLVFMGQYVPSWVSEKLTDYWVFI